MTMEPDALRTPRLHQCDICRKVGPWTKDWRSFGSIADAEWAGEHALLITCSDRCRERVERRGGPSLVREGKVMTNGVGKTKVGFR